MECGVWSMCGVCSVCVVRVAAPRVGGFACCPMSTIAAPSPALLLLGRKKLPVPQISRPVCCASPQPRVRAMPVPPLVPVRPRLLVENARRAMSHPTRAVRRGPSKAEQPTLRVCMQCRYAAVPKPCPKPQVVLVFLLSPPFHSFILSFFFFSSPSQFICLVVRGPGRVPECEGAGGAERGGDSVLVALVVRPYKAGNPPPSPRLSEAPFRSTA